MPAIMFEDTRDSPQLHPASVRTLKMLDELREAAKLYAQKFAPDDEDEAYEAEAYALNCWQFCGFDMGGLAQSKAEGNA